MDRILSLDSQKCTYCQICTMACSLRFTGEINPSRSRIQIVEYLTEGQFIPLTCTQCDEAWCQKACPTRSIWRNRETNALHVKDETCVGCKMCVMACPFGTITIDHKTEKAIKCDLCSGEPECARLCPTGAIQYTDMGSYVFDKMRSTSRPIMESSQTRRA